MATKLYGHRFVLQGDIPRSNGGMRIIIEFDTGEEPDHWGLKGYEPILEMLATLRAAPQDLVIALQAFKPRRYTDEIQPPAEPLPEERGPLVELGVFEIEEEFHGNPMRSEDA